MSAPLIRTPIAGGADAPLGMSHVYEFDENDALSSQTLEESDFEHSAATALLGLFASAPSPPIPAATPFEKRKLDAPGMSGVAPLVLGAVGWEADSGSSGSASPKVARRAGGKDGAPPPGSCRFQCRYPGCSKLYASTDAVRKHCRKRHYDWLRRLDQMASHERQMPKPALYCRWGTSENLPQGL